MGAEKVAQVAGGGIGGLSAAVFLAERGWSVTVHEQAQALTEVGAGLLLKPNSTQALKQAGVFQLLPHEPSIVAASEFRDRHGRLIARYPHGGESPFYCPLRQEVVTALVARAENLGVRIETNRRVEGADPAGELLFEDGTRARGDLVVGADGWRSRVRHSLQLGRSVQTLENGAARIVVPREPGETDTVYQEYWAGHRRIGLTPVEPGLLYIFLSCPTADVRGASMPLDIDSWSGAFPGLPESLFDRIREGNAVRHPYNYVRTRAWSRGRVAIVGDSASGLPPTLAQGAGLAIMNAYGLAIELETAGDQSSAFDAWERRYRPITRATQAWSMRYLKVSNLWISQFQSIQRATLSITRLDAVNARMRIADRVIPTTQGPMPLAAVH